jgi:hypothetical protein
MLGTVMAFLVFGENNCRRIVDVGSFPLSVGLCHMSVNGCHSIVALRAAFVAAMHSALVNERAAYYSCRCERHVMTTRVGVSEAEEAAASMLSYRQRLEEIHSLCG